MISRERESQSVQSVANGICGTASHVVMRKEEIIDILRAIDGVKRKLQMVLK